MSAAYRLMTRKRLTHFPQLRRKSGVISIPDPQNQAIFSTTFSIIFGLFGMGIFNLCSRGLSSIAGVATIRNRIFLSRVGRRTSNDLSSRNSSSSFLGAVPSPDPFIHCWSVRHRVNARKQTRMCAWVRSSLWWKIGRIPRSYFSVRKESSTSVSWMYVFHNVLGSVSLQFVRRI